MSKRHKPPKQPSAFNKVLARVPRRWVVAATFASVVLVMGLLAMLLPSDYERLDNCRTSCAPRDGKLVPAQELPTHMFPPGKSQRADFCECQ